MPDAVVPGDGIEVVSGTVAGAAETVPSSCDVRLHAVAPTAAAIHNEIPSTRIRFSTESIR